jgi:hypothetical protein
MKAVGGEIQFQPLAGVMEHWCAKINAIHMHNTHEHT